jgi:ABC-2 type transport system permease protein
MSMLSNTVTIARREATVRARTRTFIVGTIALMVGVVAIALVPVLVQYLEGHDTKQMSVYVGTADLRTDPAATLAALLNAEPSTGTSATSPAATAVEVTTVTDLAAARTAVDEGRSDAVLAIDRGPDGQLTFTLYTNQPATSGSSRVVQQAANAVAVADRLDRLGVEPADQGTLFQPADFSVAWADETRTEPTLDDATMGSSYLLGFGMSILIFMMIVLYGSWIAMSVVEEKSSRVMEVILNAATPFQLLSGKVLGVGAVALLQYLGILVAGVVALLVQDRVAAAVLGTSGSVGLPEGLTIPLLVLFCIYGVLGFLLYAALYAAAGSLVSRQEDVSTAIMPLTMITAAGYMIGVYASTGMLDIRAGWIVVLSEVPFLSPFLMLSRVVQGEATAVEVLLSIVLLVVAIPIAVWLAGRVYSVGVLLYGQRPGMRTVLRLVRSGV